jgi:RNA polymerase sigma-70 factor, ECF subfamily
LIAVLDPDVVLRADKVVARAEAAIEIRGAPVVAKRALAFSERGRSSQLLLVNGAVGGAWFQDGRPALVFTFTVHNEKIYEIELIAEPERLRSLDLASLNGD